MSKKIGFVSSRRAEESIAANMSLRENVYINPVATGKRVAQFTSRRDELDGARAVLKRYGVRPEEPEQAVATLSGGNQQKVVLARWMEADVRLLVLEEPTIGVDVGSKAEIYHLLQQSLKEGLAVLLVSSDFEEVERICHRALILSRGRVVSEIPRHEITIARLTSDASGGAQPDAEGVRQ
jgi:ribose transport system ATP-binding protein